MSLELKLQSDSQKAVRPTFGRQLWEFVLGSLTCVCLSVLLMRVGEIVKPWIAPNASDFAPNRTAEVVGLIALGILGSGTLSLWRKKRYGAALGVAFSLPFILFVFFLKVIGPVH